MKYLFFVILFSFCIFQNYSEKTDDGYLTFENFMTEPVYGEENAPDNIYYKFIRNSQSESFFYYQKRLETDIDGRLTLVFIIPQQGNDSVFLVYLEDSGALYQYSIMYNPHVLPHYEKRALYSTKYFFKKPVTDFVDYDHLFAYFTKHMDFEYKLIYKNDLESLLDNTVPRDTRVYIDKIDLADPKYVRERKN